MIALLLAACTTYTHTETLEALEQLPALEDGCAPDQDDVVSEDGDRAVTRIEPTATGCRASLYARTALIDWREVRRDIDRQAPDKAAIEWTQVSAAFDRLGVETVDGDLPPAGTTVQVAQLLTGTSAAYRGFEADPLALADDLRDGALTRRPEHLVSFSHTLDGASGPDVAGDLALQRRGEGPADAVNASFDGGQDALMLVTVADVEVTDEALAEVGTAELVLDLLEQVDLVAGVSFKLFGGE
ncbi:MAG: hypothetical protein R3F59_13610 [Myxococcota bacterium]